MFLNIENDRLLKQNAYETAREITQQPSTWIKTLAIIKSQQYEIASFIENIGTSGSFDIVFMGAGTSEYIGNTLVSIMNPITKFSSRSVPTTDMVLDPEQYIQKDRPTLFVSFARSGNSPESIGAVEAIDVISNHAYHLFITCNKDGQLYKRSINKQRTYSILLPDETNDLGFAMTSSFSNMLLAAVLVFHLNDLPKLGLDVMDLAYSIDSTLNEHAEKLQNIIEAFDFNRIVYLGSQAMKGIAQESVLKVLELTTGKVATQFDSFLGFRHGPKSFINDKTLIIAYLSDDEFIRRYEQDLLFELEKQKKGYRILVVNHKHLKIKCDYQIELSYHRNHPMIFVAIKMLMVAHCLSFLKSFDLGITTDNPCPTGEVNRVVTGVTIYPIGDRK